MGFFDSSDGELVVQFYDDPKQTLQQSQVSVAYTFTSGGVGRVARDFAQYYAKVLYCLGAGMPATMLHIAVSTPLMFGLTKSTDVMWGDGYSMQMVQRASWFTKRCSAKFYPNRPPVTKFSAGGEDYYAPMSCLAFLQHIINDLNEADLQRFSDSVRSSTR
jgi:hypothetical protein